jgi:hypothetical protein
MGEVILSIGLGMMLFLSGFLIGRQERRPQVSAPPPEPEPICGCGHHVAFHNTKAGDTGCRFQLVHNAFRADLCSCVRYVGPEIYPSFITGDS